MDIELLEIRDFIESLPRFQGIDDDAMVALVQQMRIRYLRRGSPFPPEHDADLYILRQGAIELRDDEGELQQKLAEGDSYEGLCGEGSKTLIGHCSEDTLLYLLPCDVLPQSATQAVELGQANPEFGHGGDARNPLLRLSVEQLINRPATTIAPDTGADEAARVMTREQVSAVVVTDNGQLLGILTDKDLRSRLLAEGRPVATPVSTIMTERLHKLDAYTPAIDALMLMARHNIHHLPVLRRGQLLGLLTHADLLRHESANSVTLIAEIHRASDRGQLIELARHLPELQRQLVASRLDSQPIGASLSAIADALSQRLIQLTEAELGAPPVAYCWLASGSLARRELTVGSDQDHALLLADDFDPAQHDDYFQALSERVSEGLAACGLALCPGGVMASNPQWRKSLGRWKSTFDDWILNPDPKAVMLASNFFDLRPVSGESALFEALQRHTLKAAEANRIFIAHMAANALHHRPPLGFFRNFLLEHGGEHADSFDLKRRGIIPIVDIARLYALANALPEVNTLERLLAAAEAGAMSRSGADELSHAYEFINTLRLRHQSERILSAETIDNYLDPAGLSARDRAHLKECFALIRDFQSTLEQRYQSGRFA